MARIRIEIIEALRKTAERIEKSGDYQWGHMGSCNCGFLAQQITNLSKAQIHASAMERYGDWNDQLNDYCPTSGLRMDSLISEMILFGFDADDLKHLERLSDPDVLNFLPHNRRYLSYNVKQDVILYIKSWADLLEEKLLHRININDALAAHTNSNL